MPLSERQLRKKLEETENRRYSPTDTVYTVEESTEPEGDWLALAKNASEQQAKNAQVMLNISSEGSPQSTSVPRVLASAGFECPVLYRFLHPGSYKPWTKDSPREVTQVVLHSVGAAWHAYPDGDRWAGYMNQGLVEVYIDAADPRKTLRWVPQGSTPPYMAHRSRLSSILNTLAHVGPGVALTHFFIDRDGILYVLCDCNHILQSSASLSETCVSVSMEEALYAEEVGGMYPNVFTWDPPRESTLAAWDYSEAQWRTLTALLYKLRTAYPALNSTQHSSAPFSVDSSFTGLTMLGHVADARPQDIGVYPHLQSSQEWESLFSTVQKQSHLASYAVWRKAPTGPASRTAWVEELALASTPGINPWTSINPTYAMLAGVHRAHQVAIKTSKDYRRDAATFSRNNSKLLSARVSVSRDIEAQSLVLPALPTPHDASTVDVDDGVL